MDTAKFTTSTMWNVPSGVTSLSVRVWGAGGGGGYSKGSGGGGGAYHTGTITGLTGGESITINVGTGGTAGTSGNVNGGAGGASSAVFGMQSVTANGGGGGLTNQGTVGAGGTGGTFTGGNGASHASGGGAGGGAGNTGSGANASNQNGGAGGTGNGTGYAGGAGGGSGTAGATNGGGGGGGSNNNNGAAGARGYVVLIYGCSAPTCSITGPNGPLCPSSTGHIYSGPSGTGYSWSWGISGNGSISGSSTSQNVTVTAGASNNVSYTLTLTVTAGGTCSSTCTKSVSVQDNTAPSVTCKSHTVNLNGSGTGTITPANVYNNGSDNCGTVNLVSASPSSFTCANIGANLVTLTVNDGNGNTNTCTSTVTVQDNTAPSVTCKSHTVILNGSGSGSITPGNIYNNGSDNCGTVNLVSASPSSFTCANIGANIVTLTVNDGNGNTNTCTSTVTVQDNTAPNAICKNVTVQLDNTGNGSTTAAAVNNGSSDACGIASLSLNQTAFNCSHVGSNPVILTVTDVNANSSTCTATVTVEDNQNPIPNCPTPLNPYNPDQGECNKTLNLPALPTDNCGILSINYKIGMTPITLPYNFPAGNSTVDVLVTDVNNNTATCSYIVTVNTCMNFSGKMIWKGNGVDGVKDVMVTLSGDANDSDLTGVPGTYNLIANTGDDFIITPVKNINLLNGVDVADASRISQHMAGNYLTDFYRKVSADVNKSSTISTVDASLIKQALLGNAAAIAIFNATSSWRFVDTDFSPPGSAPFVVPTFPSTRTYTAASGNYTDQDFYGIKIGDVLDNTNPQNLISERIPSMVWMARERKLNSGETIDVEFSVQNWKNIAAFQYELKFDPSVLEFADLEMLQNIIDFNKEENFGVSNIQNGELKIIFTSTIGSELEIASKVFKLRFKVLQSATKLSDVLSLSNTELKPIAYTENLISTDLKLLFTEGSVSNSNDQNELEKVELLQNRPNPFSDFTSIGFILPTAMDARLNIYDASGRMLWMVKKSYDAGYHEEKIRLNETLTPGVYFYELTTTQGSLVKRMILIRE